jgi:hypothetical protein
MAVVVYGAVDASKPWHPLQQVAKSETNNESIDENSNEIIDQAERCGSGGVCEVRSVGSDTKIVVNTTSNSFGALDFLIDGAGKWGLGLNTVGDFYIDEFGVANRLTIKQGGNVGIGTTSPEAKLDVVTAPSGTITGAGIRLTSDDGSRSVQLRIGNYVDLESRGAPLYINNGPCHEEDDCQDVIIVPSGGKVGVGTAPDVTLDVVGSTHLHGYTQIGDGYHPEGGNYGLYVPDYFRTDPSIKGKIILIGTQDSVGGSEIHWSGVAANNYINWLTDIYKNEFRIRGMCVANEGDCNRDAKVRITLITENRGNITLEVDGRVIAERFITGDIILRKSEKDLWRMFEKEDGIFVENLLTGKIYRFVLEEVK